jgi:hypothetical protein
LQLLAQNRIEQFSPDLVKFEIDPITLAQVGESRFITKKKRDNGFVADAKKYNYITTISTDNNEIYFFEYLESKDNTHYLFYQFADKNNTPLAEPVKIAKHKDFEESDSEKYFRKGSFKIGTNRNNSILYVINQEPHNIINKKKDEYKPGEVSVTFFNPKDMKELSSATYDLSISSFADLAFLSDDGIMYSLSKNNYTEEIEAINKKGKSQKEVKLRWFFKAIALNVNKPELPAIEKNIIIKDNYVFQSTSNQ